MGGTAGPTGGASSGGQDSQAGAGANAGGAGGDEATEGGSSGAEAGGASGGAGGGSEGGAAGADFAGAGGQGGEFEIGSSIYPLPPGEDNVPKPAGATGGLEVKNWAGFKSAVSYTFDDTNSSQTQHYATLNELGVRMTFYLQTARGEFSSSIWTQAVLDGHELGNHTVHHLSQDDLQKLSQPEEEVDAATREIESKFGVKVWTMAAPFGAFAYGEMARTRFLLNRGVNNGVILPNDTRDPFSINCFIPEKDAPASQFNEQVDLARTAGGWRVFLVHGFTGGTDYAYLPVAITEFTQAVTYAKSLGDVWIDSVVNIGAYWLGQRAFKGATQTTVGDSTVWKWHLPDHFPPHQYLRVSVTGGTLKQADKALEWNPRGFYEVALDVGSLTLSP